MNWNPFRRTKKSNYSRDKEILKKQLSNPVLKMPFGSLHSLTQKILGRPVSALELSNPDKLLKELNK